MALNYITLLWGRNFNSKSKGHNAIFITPEKACTCIYLRTRYFAEQLQTSYSDENQEKISKLTEIITEIHKKSYKESFCDWMGVIYFKAEQNLIHPILAFQDIFSELVSANYPNSVVLLEGKLTLEDDGHGPKTKYFHKSFPVTEKMNSLPLTPPFSYKAENLITQQRWILQSFSISIGMDNLEMKSAEMKLRNANPTLQILFAENSSKDFTLWGKNGVEIKCHSLILAAQSPSLAELVRFKMSERKGIELDFSEETLSSFVRYIYSENVPLKEMKCSTALELFKLGQMWELPELSKSISKLMEQKSEDWFTADCILGLYFIVRNQEEFKELSDHAVEIVLKLSGEMRQCEEYKKLDLNEVNELLWILLNKMKTNFN